MSMNDPIADLLTRIRNSSSVSKKWVDVKCSNVNIRILYILKEEFFIRDYVKIEDNKSINKLNFNSRIDKAQIELLKLLCNNNNSIRDYVIEKISLDYFSTPFLKNIAGCLLDEKLEFDFSVIIEKFENKEERDLVTKILFMDSTDIPPEEIVSDCLKILISAPIKEKIKILRMKIREKESNGKYPRNEISKLEKYRQRLNDI